MSLTAREMSATARSRAHEAKLAKQTRSSQGAKLNAFMEGLLKGGRKRVSPVRHAVDSPVGDRAGGMTRVQDARWEIVSRGGSLSKSGAVLTCADALEEGVYAAVAGPLLNASGLTEFSLAILKSESNTGGAMLLGVVEDTDEGHHHEQQGAATERASGWGRAFGLAPWNGRFFGFPHADTRDPSRAGEVRGDALMVGDCRGSAEGTSVRVRVDATHGHLYFYIRSGAKDDSPEWVLARENGQPIVLPKGMRLRPFARCGTQNDMVALSSAVQHTAHEELAPAAVPIPQAIPQESPVLRLPPPPAPMIRRPASPAPEPKRASAPAPPRPEVEPSSRVGDLLRTIEELRAELDTTRTLLEKERVLRIDAERRAAEAMRQLRVFALKMADPASANEIEASLLREVLIGGRAGGAHSHAGDGSGQQSTLDQERERQHAIQRNLAAAAGQLGSRSRRPSLEVMAFGAGSPR